MDLYAAAIAALQSADDALRAWSETLVDSDARNAVEDARLSVRDAVENARDAISA